MKNEIEIEVVFASAQRYQTIPLQVPNGTTIEQAIHASGILTLFPEISLSLNRVGIFGKLKLLTEVVEAQDRIEIYRPLPQSAIAARKARLKEQRSKRQLQVKDRE